MNEVTVPDSPAGSQDLLLHHKDPDTRVGGGGSGLWGLIAVLVWAGVLGAGLLIALFVALFLVIAGVRELLVHAGVIVDDASGPWPLVAGIVVMFSGALWSFGWFAARSAVLSSRSARGAWRVRLSSSGFEVNDRLGRPRRYQWRDIDVFMVCGGYVCFRYSAEHRRSLVNKLWSGFSGLRDSAGTGAHGWIPILSWDRPADEAVALMNTRLSHARPS